MKKESIDFNAVFSLNGRAIDSYSVNNFLKFCVICGCGLDSDSCSEGSNICKSCLRNLEFLIMLKSPRNVLTKYNVRVCRWQGGYCSRSCSWLDRYGAVKLCSEHGNPSGLLTRKRRVFH